MLITKRSPHLLPLAAIIALATSPLFADRLSITIENTLELDGFFFTPVWVALHDGTFDLWSAGQSASDFAGLEDLAEQGDTGPIASAFLGSPAGLAGGIETTIAALRFPAPVYGPGESSTLTIDVADPLVQRYLSFASMVVPSNDLFMANSEPTEHAIFDAAGEFLGPVTIEVLGSMVADCGTELNDIAGDAAFTTLGGTATDEMNPLAGYFDLDPTGAYLDSAIGVETPTGAIIERRFDATDVVARITVRRVPDPDLVVSIENLMPTGGFFLTPFWVAIHDGDFDLWSAGELASSFSGLESLAEEGDTGPISGSFLASDSGVAGGVDATVAALAIPAPVYSPGESSRMVISAGNPLVNRYFSYGSMVHPSNDLFVANGSPTAHLLFDDDGVFTGPVTIEIFGSAVVDAGTEVNDIEGGAAFSTLGGTPADESNPLATLFDLDPAAAYLGSILGTETATGDIVAAAFTSDQLIARITITLSTGQPFSRGDVTSDGQIDLADPIDILSALFSGGTLDCEEAADVNDSGVVDLADAALLLDHLFLGGFSPSSPFGTCSFDATPDELSCDSSPTCP